MRHPLVTAAVLSLLSLQLLLARPARAQQQTPPPAPAATPAGAGADDDEVERVSVHVVSVPVSVTDRDGRFVAGLGATDFDVRENGREQAVSYFASVEQPFSVLLLIDTSGSTSFRLGDIQEAAVAFVEQLRPQDRVLPVAFDNDAVALLPGWTGDRTRLATAIRSTRTGMVPVAGDRQVVKGRDGKPVTLLHVDTRLYDAVHAAAEVLRGVSGRKAMILFTDGFDSASRAATRRSTLAELEEMDALVYVVQYPRGRPGRQSSPRDALPPVASSPQIGRKGVVEITTGSGGQPQIISPNPSAATRAGGVANTSSPQTSGGGGRPQGPRPPREVEAEDYLESLAEKTGGRYYYADSLERVAQSFASVAEELRRMYSIGYSPTPLARAGERREVKIKVRRDNVSVRARRSYVFRPL